LVELDEAKRLTRNDKKMPLLKKTKKCGEKIENHYYIYFIYIFTRSKAHRGVG